ncbi:MAG: hypothetical protein L0Y44_01820 [Phycisphaerales bacterium]|nr:hypothetical protein [Phycisphaerales bacterium]MCI0629374.1 hypothetical protein [Phycisphaerales bacterium]MCI0674976.1 hypothetical protein [Phycisphaerales bacterium]
MIRAHMALMFMAGLMLLSTGCQAPPDTSPSAGQGDWYPAPMNDPQISVVSPELRDVLWFQPAIVTNDGQRPMSVEVPMRNVTTEKYLVEFRIVFFDEHDRQINPVMSWEFMPVLPKQVVRLKRSAMSTDAEGYRLEVKWSR